MEGVFNIHKISGRNTRNKYISNRTVLDLVLAEKLGIISTLHTKKNGLANEDMFRGLLDLQVLTLWTISWGVNWRIWFTLEISIWWHEWPIFVHFWKSMVIWFGSYIKSQNSSNFYINIDWNLIREIYLLHYTLYELIAFFKGVLPFRKIEHILKFDTRSDISLGTLGMSITGYDPGILKSLILDDSISTCVKIPPSSNKFCLLVWFWRQ